MGQRGRQSGPSPDAMDGAEAVVLQDAMVGLRRWLLAEWGLKDSQLPNLPSRSSQSSHIQMSTTPDKWTQERNSKTCKQNALRVPRWEDISFLKKNQ